MKRSNRHRRVYESHYGKIPTDADGRTFDIHHINGNHEDNRPENLIAVSLQEHYDIHYSQGDYAACQAIVMRMNLDPSHYSTLARLRYENGTHPVQMMSEEKHLEISSLGGKASMKKLLETGKHVSQTRSVEEKHRIAMLGGKASKETQHKLLANGKHPFQQITPEEKLSICKKAGASRAKQHKEDLKNGKHLFQNLTTEQKRANALKAWETRRAKKLQETQKDGTRKEYTIG